MMNRFAPPSYVEGRLERVTYYNPETHFTVARLRTHPSDHLITVLGILAEPRPGEILKIHGEWETHPRYGEQLRIQLTETVLPSSLDGIRMYLGSGCLKGIGPKTAARLIRHFGDRTLEVIENSPQRLTEIPGIGPATAAVVSDAWSRHHHLRKLIALLQESGIRTSYSGKIIKAYGTESLDVLRTDPYRLAADLPGIGFAIADGLARKAGMVVDEEKRVEACILFLLQRVVEDGHVYVLSENLLAQCEKEFYIPREAAEDALSRLAGTGGRIVVEDAPGESGQAVYPKSLHDAEAGIARKLRALLSFPDRGFRFAPEDITEAVMRKLAIHPSEEQLAVLQGVMSLRVAIITGGPGTGKTTLIRSLAILFELSGRRTSLAAPTGRAARRLSEVTGRKAETLHRLLGYNPNTDRFEKNADEPLQTDVVIVDEASMVDTLLMFHLLQAVHLETKLILVGDVFQLPPVGPGNVLADLIRSGCIQTFELRQIFRQTQTSPIIFNAHKVLKGEMPDFEPTTQELDDFCFIETNRPQDVVNRIVELCFRRIPHRFGLDPIRDVQVLTPMHRGLVGTLNLNQVLQERLNPNPVRISVPEGTFNLGDKVMHLKNNYEKEVFNGDIGTVLSVEKADETLWVDYEGRTVTYHFTELEELTLAYAISVHKSQGSEYPAVILPLMPQHFPLLQRNLLYTGISRGKEAVILVGSRKALMLALNNDTPQKRLSGLAHRLGIRR